MARVNENASQVAETKARINQFTTQVKNMQTQGSVKVGIENFIAPGEVYDTGRDTVVASLKTALGNAAGIKPGNESNNEMYQAITKGLTNAQYKAAANIMTAAALGNESLTKYHNAAIADVKAAGEGVADIALVQVGAFGSSSMPAGEYFNNGTELDKHVGASIEFNLQASRQNDEWEHMYPTVTLDPSDIGMEVDINLLYVHQQVRHSMNKKDNAPFKRRNILDSITDATVFDDNTIKFHPYFKEDVDGDYREFFVPEALKEPTFPVSDSHTVRTNPLKFNTGPKPLMSLSAHPGSVGSSSRDETDEFDPRFRMQSLYVLVSKPDQKPANDEGQLVEFPTLNLPKSAFQLVQEGNMRTMRLQFRDNLFTLHGDRKDVAGNPVEALAEVKNGEYLVSFEVEVTSEINLQDGIEKNSRAFLTLTRITDKNGVIVGMEKGPGKVIKDSMQLTPYGYDWAATLSNANRRSRGTLLDNQAEVERYKTTLQSPITMQKPVGSQSAGPEESQVANLILAARLRNNAQAGTKTLNYEATLEDVYRGHTQKYEVAHIEGVGRWYVHPWYQRELFDADLQISALQSSDVPGELRVAMLNVIRDMITRAFVESRFEPALQVYSKYTMSRPKIGILTDPVISNWLWQSGDTRSLGEGFEFYIDHTYDSRFADTIRWYFSTTNEGFHALHFGAFLWVSELVTTTSMSRDNRIADELTVQPRCEHIVNCPIMGRIDVKNLSKYVRQAPNISVRTKTALKDAVVVEDVPVKPAP